MTAAATGALLVLAAAGAAFPGPGVGPRPGPDGRAAAPPSSGPGSPAPVAYLEGPPPAHTGGFGEPTCRACHFDRPLNPGAGEVRLEGVPGRYAADSTYLLTVVLEHPEMQRGGFQLAARWRAGERRGCPAGRLEPTGPRTQDVADRDSLGPGPGSAAGEGTGGGDASAGPASCRVVYVQHTGAGTRPVEDGRIRWRVRWRAPSRRAGAVAFHVAANAANDDASEFGDRIYATEAVSRAPR